MDNAIDSLNKPCSAAGRRNIFPNQGSQLKVCNYGAERNRGYFNLGARRALQSKIQRPMGVGLMADAAIGYWKQGKLRESISEFVQVLELLESIPTADDIRLRHLHATIRHCISWIHFEARQERLEQLIEPHPGTCSNQEPHEGIKDHRIVDISAAWLLLDQTEKLLGIDCGLGARAEKFSNVKQPLFVAVYIRTLEFEAAVKTPPWNQVVSAFVRMQEAMAYSRELRFREHEDNGWQPGEIPPLPHEYWQDSRNLDLMFPALLAACINCLAHHPSQAFPIGTWRRDIATAASLTGELSAFLEVLEGHPGDGSLYQEVGNGLTILREENVAVESLWEASFRILNAFEKLKRWAERDIEVLLTKRWTTVADNQRFAFRTPSLSVPAIKNACADETRTGLSKVATIVTVAAPYLSIRMAPEAKDMLKRIAAS